MKAKLPMLAMACLLLSACTGLSANRYLGNKHLFMVGRGDPTAYADGYVDGVKVAQRIAAGTHHTCAVTGNYAMPSKCAPGCSLVSSAC